jgi:charged multivesicular body protein 4A/B
VLHTREYFRYWHLRREDLREQHALGEEIANAITNAPLGETIDETALDDELAEMEQEQLDNKMLKTGTVPVSDEIHRLPAAVNGERTYPVPERGYPSESDPSNSFSVKNKQPARQEEEDEEEELRKLQAEMAM